MVRVDGWFALVSSSSKAELIDTLNLTFLSRLNAAIDLASDGLLYRRAIRSVHGTLCECEEESFLQIGRNAQNRLHFTN